MIDDRRLRQRVLKTVAVLPSLATLGNLVCGLGSIYACLLAVGLGGSAAVESGVVAGTGSFRFLAIASYLLVAAMVFDALDGRLARFARKTSEFGGQLDSLADVVSFGVAPAVLVLCIARPGDIAILSSWERMYWRAEWVMAATYVCCAALRLAKFNVENVEDESAHMAFRGLPTPGAAAAVIGLVILHQDLLRDVAPIGVSNLVRNLMPPFAMALGLLMVSRFPYAHMVNTLLRGRRSFRQVVAIVILALIGLVVQFQLTIAVAAAAYAFSGPVVALIRRARGVPIQLAADGETATDWTGPAETFVEAENGTIETTVDDAGRSVGFTPGPIDAHDLTNDPAEDRTR